MALKLPNDKVVYNLPEQVGVNAENIGYLAEVYKTIDELPAKWAAWKEAADDVMDGYSDTMGDYATTMGGYQTTMQGYANTMGGYQTTMEGWALQVDTWTNNIAVAAATAITGQDITPKTVAQTQANYVGNINIGKIGDTTITAVYNKFEVINGVLYIILNFLVNNSTASDKTITSGSTLFSVEATNIPSSISENIYDLAGNTVRQAVNPQTLITAFDFYVAASPTNFSSIKRGICKITNAESNYIRGYGDMTESLTIPANGSVCVSGRIMLTLL